MTATSCNASHEHLDELNLIHMNGRIYDPALGRFMTADPLVQSPGNPQSYNRYSYVLNNPLIYTDPSGYCQLLSFGSNGCIRQAEKTVTNFVTNALDDPVRTAVTIVAAYYTGQWIGSSFAASGTEWAVSSWTTTYSAGQVAATSYTLSTAGAIAAGAGAGFAGGLVASNGDFEAAFGSALAGSISGGIGGYFGSAYPLERVAANSLAGGFQAKLRGGSFYEGMLSSFRNSALAYLNVQMRNAMIQQSRLDPRNDGTGLSRGMYGDLFKLAGGRWNPFADPQCSTLGCLQSGPGSMFGISYAKGGFVDMIAESFAGPHDMANSPWFYDSNGLIKDMTGRNAFALELTTNYSTSLIFAAPFAAGAIAEQTNHSAYRKLDKR